MNWLDIALGVGAGYVGVRVLSYLFSLAVGPALSHVADWRDGYRRPWPWSPFRSRLVSK